METTQQLEDKLKEKVDKELVEKIDLHAEQDIFHKWGSAIAQFAITINSNVCPHIRVLNTLMRES